MGGCLTLDDYLDNAYSFAFLLSTFYSIVSSWQATVVAEHVFSGYYLMYQ